MASQRGSSKLFIWGCSFCRSLLGVHIHPLPPLMCMKDCPTFQAGVNRGHNTLCSFKGLLRHPYLDRVQSCGPQASPKSTHTLHCEAATSYKYKS